MTIYHQFWGISVYKYILNVSKKKHNVNDNINNSHIIVLIIYYLFYYFIVHIIDNMHI